MLILLKKTNHIVGNYWSSGITQEKWIITYHKKMQQEFEVDNSILWFNPNTFSDHSGSQTSHCKIQNTKQNNRIKFWRHTTHKWQKMTKILAQHLAKYFVVENFCARKIFFQRKSCAQALWGKGQRGAVWKSMRETPCMTSLLFLFQQLKLSHKTVVRWVTKALTHCGIERPNWVHWMFYGVRMIK